MSSPTPDQLNLAAALECLRLMLETQQQAMTADEPTPTPLQKLLATWGIK